MPRRVAQETPHKDIDILVQGRREQHPLAIRRGGFQQPAHYRQKPEISHVVRLVDHADLDIAKLAVTLLDKIGQPSRAGDDDIGPGPEGSHLAALGGAAEDRHYGQPHRLGQRCKNRLDLTGKFPGGDQHQAARAAGHRVALGQCGDQRDGERDRLA